MTNILTINSSPKTEGSISRDLVERFVDKWRAHHTAGVVARDVGTTPPPHLDEATIGAFYTPEDALSPDQQARIAFSDELVGELEAADVIVIGAPMHNFGLTSGLKAWIDHVARVGRTFKYTENGPEGLLTGKKVYVLTARGGNYTEYGSTDAIDLHPAPAMDHQAPYLRTVLGFLGLDDVTFIHAHGVAGGEDGIRAAEVEVDTIVAAAVQRLAA
jgi:FMN-dependent NADH-azoreductase